MLLKKKLIPLAAAVLTMTGLVAVAPAATASPSIGEAETTKVVVGKADAKVGGATHIAFTQCKAEGRWGKGYIRTDGKPTSSRPLVNIVEWGYYIQRTSGDHKNSRVSALQAVHESTGNWRLTGGPGQTGWDAIEDNKWHKGKQTRWPAMGRGANGELAAGFWFDFDKGTGGHCDAPLIRYTALKPI